MNTEEHVETAKTLIVKEGKTHGNHDQNANYIELQARFIVVVQVVNDLVP